MTKFAIVDIETLGLNSDIHPVFEVGLILRDIEAEDTTDREFSWFLPVAPETLIFADPFALKLNGFNKRHPQGLGFIDQKDGRVSRIAEEQGLTDADKFARQFCALTQGAIWIGSVPSFDEERLRQLVRSQGVMHDWHYQLIDVETLAAGKIKGTHTGKWTLEEAHAVSPPYDTKAITQLLGLDPSQYEADKHTALGDCRWARDVYDAVME